MLRKVVCAFRHSSVTTFQFRSRFLWLNTDFKMSRMIEVVSFHKSMNISVRLDTRYLGITVLINWSENEIINCVGTALMMIRWYQSDKTLRPDNCTGVRSPLQCLRSEQHMVNGHGSADWCKGWSWHSLEHKSYSARVQQRNCHQPTQSAPACPTQYYHWECFSSDKKCLETQYSWCWTIKQYCLRESEVCSVDWEQTMRL